MFVHVVSSSFHQNLYNVMVNGKNSLIVERSLQDTSKDFLSLDINNMFAQRRFSRRGSYEVGLKTPSFKVKTLCEEGISVDAIDSVNSNAAVDVALGAVGSLEGKNKHDVVIKVSIKDGIEVLNKKNKKTLWNYKIHQVGYCNVDKRYPQIFVFIGAKEKTDFRCHIFLCDDIAKARALCLTFAKTFQNSFSNWKKSQEMSTPDMKLKQIQESMDRRRSADVVQIPTKKQLERRRASDFVTTGGRQRLDIRRSSADAVHRGSSDEEIFDEEANQAYKGMMSTGGDKNNVSLLRRGSTDWDAIAKDEEVKRKMEGDLIVW